MEIQHHAPDRPVPSKNRSQYNDVFLVLSNNKNKPNPKLVRGR